MDNALVLRSPTSGSDFFFNATIDLAIILFIETSQNKSIKQKIWEENGKYFSKAVRGGGKLVFK